MIKFRILNYILILFVGFCLLACVINAYLIYELRESISRDIPIAKFVFAIIKGLVFSISLIFIKQACRMFLKHSYFNSKSVYYLTIGGFILILSALMGLGYYIFIISSLTKEQMKHTPAGIINDVTILVIGFALIAIADIIKKGINIKLENDLTI